MTEPALFTVQRSGRVEVMLGRHVVGFIEPWNGPQRRGGSGPIGAYYWIVLPIDGGGQCEAPGNHPEAGAPANPAAFGRLV
jgi:hypothetical protein